MANWKVTFLINIGDDKVELAHIRTRADRAKDALLCALGRLLVPDGQEVLQAQVTREPDGVPQGSHF